MYRVFLSLLYFSLLFSQNNDNTAPTVSTYSPADGATGVSLTANLVLTFSENVSVGSGNITIKKSSDNSTVKTISAYDSSAVSISGSTVTINPNSNFSEGPVPRCDYEGARLDC